MASQPSPVDMMFFLPEAAPQDRSPHRSSCGWDECFLLPKKIFIIKMHYIPYGGKVSMKKTRAVICLTVAIVLALYPTATAIVEHIKAETVEKGKTPSQPPALQSSRSEEMPGNISTEYITEQFDQTPSATGQLVPGQSSWPVGDGQEQIGGDYQAGYAAGYQEGYAKGWKDGVQATVQKLLNYINSLQDTDMVLGQPDDKGIIHPGGPTIEEGPKIKQAIDM